MPQLLQYLHDNIPAETMDNVYSRLTKDDAIAAYNDNVDALSPAGMKEIKAAVKAADDSARNKTLIPQLQTQQKELMSPQTGWRGVASDIAGIVPSALTGVAKGTEDIANLPSSIINSLAGKKVAPLFPDPADLAVSRRLNPSSIAEGLGSFVPSAIGGELAFGAKGLAELPKLLATSSKTLKSIPREIQNQTLAGGLYGASQQKDSPLIGGAVGGLLGAGIAGLGNLILPQAAKSTASFLQEPLANQALNGISELGSGSAIQTSLKKARDIVLQKAGKWNDEVLPLAQQADSFAPFNSKDYIKTIEDLQSEYQPRIDYEKEFFAKSKKGPVDEEEAAAELKKQKDKNDPLANLFKAVQEEGLAGDMQNAKPLVEEEEAKKDLPVLTNSSLFQYRDADRFLNMLLSNPPEKYVDATYLNELINNAPKNWEFTNNSSQKIIQGLASRAGDALKEQVEKNGRANPFVAEFSNAWKEHRENYKKLMAFNSKAVGDTADGDLSLQYNKNIAKMMGKSGAPDENIKLQFIPSGKNESTLQMRHLSNLLGSKDAAANAIKSDYMSQAFENNELNLQKALRLYDAVKNKQRDFLFTPKEQELFNAAIKSKNIADQKPLISFLKTQGLNSGINAAGAGLIAQQSGATNKQSLGIGGAALLGAPVASKLISKYFESPKGLNQLVSLMHSGGNQKKFTYPVLAALAPLLLKDRTNGNP
jgi:hypothetical protein